MVFFKETQQDIWGFFAALRRRATREREGHELKMLIFADCCKFRRLLETFLAVIHYSYLEFTSGNRKSFIRIVHFLSLLVVTSVQTMHSYLLEAESFYIFF